MGSVSLRQFYPQNGKVEAFETNANYTAIEGSTGGLNAENFTTEALEREHFNYGGDKILIQEARRIDNDYAISMGSSVSVDAQYHSVTDNSIATANKTDWFNLRLPINHTGSTGAASNDFDRGTCIAVGGPDGSGGSNGLQIPAGSILHVQWAITVWRNDTDAPTIGNYFSKLVNDSITTRTGIGQDSFIIYPRFNTTSGIAPWQVGDWDNPNDAGLSNDTWLSPGDGVVPLGGGGGVVDPNSSGLNNVKPFASYRTDHWTWVPHIFGTAGDQNNHEFMTWQTNGELGSSFAANETLGGPRLVTGQTYIKVDNPTTLYGIQMFVSGLYSTHYNTSTGKNGVFLEDQAVSNVNGGIDGTLHIERTQISYTIYRPGGI